MFNSIRPVVIPLVALGTALALPVWGQAEVLIESGAEMVYLANATDPGIGMTWTAEGFDPGSWTAGTYGAGFETNAANSGAHGLIRADVGAGTRSLYTRATFEIADPVSIQKLHLGVDYDDGYVAWINGVEVFRSSQLPAGDLNWDSTPASHESSNGAGPNYFPYRDITTAALPAMHAGENVLALAVWNRSASSSDLVLVPRLLLDQPDVFVTRGPYLQSGTDHGVVVRWRTDLATDSRVRYGTDPDDLGGIADTAGSTFDHEVELQGLLPDTRYYYAIGTSSEMLAGGSDDYAFRTSSTTGDRHPVRIWVIGDSGSHNGEAAAVRDAYDAVSGSAYTDVWLMLGDNAYNDGTDDEYQQGVFDAYPEMLRRSVVWPTLGNHDARSADSAGQSGVYYDIFTLPEAGQAGGFGSGTEAYYAFDFANIHFVCLNSQDVSRSSTGSMAVWLEADLAATDQDWIIAFWHHPPYSKGSHDSDAEGALIEMRENIVPILEDWGVDLVLGGHSHAYERSVLLDGHYGTSGSLTPAMKLDEGDGRIDGDGAYQKAGAGPNAHEGAVYIVAGSSGKLSSAPLNHPAMYLSALSLGSMILEIEGDRLSAQFIDEVAVQQDRFTIVKNASGAPSADFDASPANGNLATSVTFSDLSSTNVASWAWDLDGDSTVDSTEPAPSFLYSAPGLYDVSLTVSNASGTAIETKTALICISGGVPADATGLAFQGDSASLSWDAVGGADRYDLARGSLTALQATGAPGAALDGCLVDGGTALSIQDLDEPNTGEGFFYLARAVSCEIDPGSYDTGGSGQVAGRDPAIQASGWCE